MEFIGFILTTLLTSCRHMEVSSGILSMEVTVYSRSICLAVYNEKSVGSKYLRGVHSHDTHLSPLLMIGDLDY